MSTRALSILAALLACGEPAAPLASARAAAPAAEAPVYVVVNGNPATRSGGRWADVVDVAKELAGGEASRVLDLAEAGGGPAVGGGAAGKPGGGDGGGEAPLEVRRWLGKRVPIGATIVLLGDEASIPSWRLRVGNLEFATDAPYADLDGDGVPDTAICRISEGPDIVRRLAAGRGGGGGTSGAEKEPATAAILCSEDTRIHLETRAFLLALSDLGYDARVLGIGNDALLSDSDLIVHFGHGSADALTNRFGELFVSSRAVPPLRRSPIIFVDGCATLPPGSPLLQGLLEKGAAGYAGSTESVFGMTPARFTNELVEHFLRALAESPDAPVPRLLTAARAAYVRGHEGLAARLRELATSGRLALGGADALDVVTIAEWVYHGDPRAAIRRAGPARPWCRRALAVTEAVPLEGAASWKASFDRAPGDGQAVLAVHADIPLAERTRFALSVRQDDVEIAVLDGRRETVYQNLGDDCRGGYVSGEAYRARYLIPLRAGTGAQRLEISLARGTRATLTEGTQVDVWPPDFERRIGLRAAGSSRLPVTTEGKVTLVPTGDDAFLALDLSEVFNGTHGSTQVGGGDNASFATWFAEESVTSEGVPFRVRREGKDILVSANNSQNAFELTGFEEGARAVHLLVWGYSRPRRPARLSLLFADGTSQACEVPLREWTDGTAGFAFDFRNTLEWFRHAAIYREAIAVERPERKLTGIRSESGTYGVVAITVERAR